jgi:hypothetical protein
LAVVIQKSGNRFAIGDGGTVAEVQVDADAEAGGGARGFYTSGKRGAIGQQGSAGHDSVMEGFEDAAVDAVRPAKVIRIDYEILHGVSVYPSFTCTLVQLLFCATV